MQLFFILNIFQSICRIFWSSKTFAFSLLIVLVFSFASIQPAFAQGDWTTYLHDNTRLSANIDETTLSTTTAQNLQKKWTYQTGSVIASQAIVVNNVVYEGSWDGNEYALDANTGKVLWKTFLGITTDNVCNTSSVGVTSSPTVQNGVVYVGGGDANWYALDATNGNVLWKVFTGDNSPTGGHYNWASPLIYNGNAYIGVASLCDQPLVQGQVIEVNLQTHQIVHTLNLVGDSQVGAGVWTSPAIDPSTNTLYVTTGTLTQNEPNAQAMVAIDPTMLTVKGAWQIPENGPGTDFDWGTSPTVFTPQGGSTLVSGINKDGKLYVFNAANVSSGPVWQYQIAQGGDCPQCGQGSISSGAFAQNTLYYAAGITTINGTSYKGSIRAFNPSNGNVLWSYGFSQAPLAAIAYANGILAVGAGSQFAVFNATTGALLYSTTLSAIVYGAPSISNGTIFVGTTDGNLYAFSTTGSNPAGQILGGLNLDGYCNSLGQGNNAFVINNLWYCTSQGPALNMTSACQWQYNMQNITSVESTNNDPYSWVCEVPSVTPTPTPTSTPAPTQTPTPTPSSPARLGGLDLNTYCINNNLGSTLLQNGTWYCSTNHTQIPMTSVCQQQYNDPSASAKQDRPNDPYSWSCYSASTISLTPTPTNVPTATPTPTANPTNRLGGLNLDGYCNSQQLGSSTVINGQTWICTSNNSLINLTSACQWQYNKTDAIAKQDRPNDPYSWTCYN